MGGWEDASRTRRPRFPEPKPFEVRLVLSPFNSASKAALLWSGYAALYR